MLRSSVNHVLCRKRREAIAKRAPEFHGWGHGLRAQHDKQQLEAWANAVLGRQAVFAAALRQVNERQMAELRRVGVL